ncbi:MAG: CvpA family protein [Balneolaceae bacterium]|nr:CvpA family protein [Balneolaceae bacterium]MDR9446454.1 CvpA family protein [Balneolaceae bacterium]
MNVLDGFILFPLLVAFLLGLKNGIVKEVFGLLGLFLAIVLSLWFTGPLSIFAMDMLGMSESWAKLATGVILFVFVILTVQLIAWILEKTIEAAQLSFINRTLGGLFGLGKAAFLVSLLLWALSFVDVPKQTETQSSLSYSYVRPIAPVTFSFLARFIPNTEDALQREDPSKGETSGPFNDRESESPFI